MTSRGTVTADTRTTALLSEFSADKDIALSAETMHSTARVVLDTIACAVGGAQTEPGRVIAEFKSDKGGRPEATLVVTGQRVPCGSAAYVNAHLANVFDADETFLNFSHFASTIVLPALAVAESRSATGEEFIKAVAIGYEVAARVGLGLEDILVSDSGGISRTAGSGFSWAALGTAAAASRLLGLHSAETAHAIGLAYVTAPLHGCLVNYTSTMGSRETPWHKYSMYGAIAEAGVDAALLARAGFKADDHILDVGSEFWRPLGGPSFNWDLLRADLGKAWWIDQTSLKPYPFCRYGHGLLDLLSGIVSDGELRSHDIDSIVLEIPAFPPLEVIAANQDPLRPLDIMSSLPFACGLVVMGVPPGPQWWSPEHREDPVLRSVAHKVTCRVHPEWAVPVAQQIKEDGKFRRFPVAVEVQSRGQTIRRAADYSKGDPWTSASLMTDDEIVSKAAAYCDPALGTGSGQQLAKAAFDLEHAPSVSDVIDVIRAART